MRRRVLIKLGAGTILAMRLPSAAAQQVPQARRIGVMMGLPEGDPEGARRLAGFHKVLAERGWRAGENVRADYRWPGVDRQAIRVSAQELVALKPDVLLIHSTPLTAAAIQETRTIPIVFVTVGDPVGSGFVNSVARPGGNVTGFTNHDPNMGGKWLEMLREMAPNLRRCALLYNPETTPGGGEFFSRSFREAALHMGIGTVDAQVRASAELEPTLAGLAETPGTGLVVMADPFTNVNRKIIVSLAARFRLPASYPFPGFVSDGGLMSYGVDQPDLFRRSAVYVDRILRGEKPADLPVQAPTTFHMAINLKTAKALGLTVPVTLQVRADEFIE